MPCYPTAETLSAPEGVRWWPSAHDGTGALVLAGSSGRVDSERARSLAAGGVLADAVRWFGGPSQQSGPWEVPLETVAGMVASLAAHCDRVILVGTSFGAEAVLTAAAYASQLGMPTVHGVAAPAPSDVVWSAVTPAGRCTSHWTVGGRPLPSIALEQDWQPTQDPPAFVDLYARSFDRAGVRARMSAAIPVERISRVLLVAGGADPVWPSVQHAQRIVQRRRDHDLDTTVVSHGDAGHRTVLPGESAVTAGIAMERGGDERADRRLGATAWAAIRELARSADG